MAEASMALGTGSGSAQRARTRLVGLAFFLLVLHNVDEGFIHPEHGGKLNVAGNVVLGVLIVFAYARLGRTWRATVTGVVGVLATLQALGGHIVHIVSGDATPLDYSGLLYLAGGLLLIGIAVAEFRSHGAVRPAAT